MMGVWETVKDNIRERMQSFLEIQPPMVRSYNVWGGMDFAGNAIKNRLWYRGQAHELEQFWKETPSPTDRHRFWAASPNAGREIEKIHVGLPALAVDMLTDIVTADLQQVDAGEGAVGELWDDIASENRFKSVLAEAVKDTLVIGDGAFKISVDKSVSDLPIIEWVPGDRCEFRYSRGRLCGVDFRTHQGKFTLVEEYGRGRIGYRAERGGSDVPLAETPFDVPESIEWDGGFMLAVPMMFFPSKLFEGRGGSVYDTRGENFDALDEAWSQWVDALRKARTKEYIPEALIPRNPHTGELMAPNSFDSAFIRLETSMSEGASQRVEVVQPDIKSGSYLDTYSNALDLCLMGLMSPSTLGVDLKKRDNAEAQREKEKATIYTRNRLVSVLQDTIPVLVKACVNCYETSIATNGGDAIGLTDVRAQVEFGEYANPSFESVVETVGKAKLQGIMSIEACVEELYGDTRGKDWKEREVRRLKAEQGVADLAEPAIGIDA